MGEGGRGQVIQAEIAALLAEQSKALQRHVHLQVGLGFWTSKGDGSLIWSVLAFEGSLRGGWCCWAWQTVCLPCQEIINLIPHREIKLWC